MRLPDFIVIGAPKCGTSTIFHVLRQHPDVFMGRRTDTEIEFFSLDYFYREGLSFYGTFFEAAPLTAKVGEVSPGYLSTPGVPERIVQHLPTVKLIAALRNPVDRAYSAYRMQVSKGAETSSFTEAIQTHDYYVDHSRYYQHLSRYLSFFSREQLLIVLFDELKIAPHSLFEKIFRFVDIESTFKPALRHENESGAPRYTAVTRALNIAHRTRDAVLDSPLGWLINNRYVDAGSRKLRNRIASWNRVPAAAQPIPEEARAFLVAQLQDDVHALSGLVGQDLSHWLSTSVDAGLKE